MGWGLRTPESATPETGASAAVFTVLLVARAIYIYFTALAAQRRWQIHRSFPQVWTRGCRASRFRLSSQHEDARGERQRTAALLRGARQGLPAGAGPRRRRQPPELVAAGARALAPLPLHHLRPSRLGALPRWT